MLRKAKRCGGEPIVAREGFAKDLSLLSFCSGKGWPQRAPTAVTALKITDTPRGAAATADQDATFECLERESVSNGKLRFAEGTDTSAFKVMPDFD